MEWVLLIGAGLLSVALTVAIVGGYRYGWTWTGLPDQVYTKHDNEEVVRRKTLWDWMQLLLIPAVRALGAYVLETSQSSRDHAREDQRAEQRAETDRAIARRAA
jgi:hypothetical protein